MHLTYISLSNDIYGNLEKIKVSLVFKKYGGGGGLFPYHSENEGGFCPPPSYLRGRGLCPTFKKGVGVVSGGGGGLLSVPHSLHSLVDFFTVAIFMKQV